MQENNNIVPNVQLNNIVSDIRNIILNARNKAYASINQNLIHANWEIGRRIVEEEQHGKVRAEYGTQLLKALSQQLTADMGKEYGIRNLWYFKQFCLCFPDWQIVNACVHNLKWTHIRSILRVNDPKARLWYLQEAS